jgi:hypothetical protein
MQKFDNEAYMLKLKEELVAQILWREFEIVDYKECEEEIEYATLQDPELIKRFKDYFPSLKRVFLANELRSTKPASYERDLRPVVNLLRQMLGVLGYELKPRNHYVDKTKVECLYKIKKKE